MKKKLLSSIVFVFFFWWVVFFLVWLYSIGGFSDVYQQLFVENKLPNIFYIFEAIRIAIYSWSTPIFLISISSSLITMIFVFSFYVWKNYKFNKKEIITDSWRGVNINIGSLPRPDWMPNKILQFDNVNEYVSSKIIQNNSDGLFSESHRNLIIEILSYIFQTKDTSFVGHGHGNNLYEHTLNVLDVCWTENVDPLIPIVAAAHDAGKIIAWKKHKKNWVRVGYHDDYGVLLISSLTSFEQLSEDEKYCLKIAIGFGHKENKIPHLPEDIFKRVDSIFSVVNKNDRIQTAIEKKALLEKNESPEMITEAFIQAIKSSPFNTPKTRRGQNAVCFRKGEIVYLLEPGFRDLFLSFLPSDIAAAYGGGFRRVGNISPPTVALINHMKKIGWLVEDGNGMHSECGLWSVEVGKKIFNGVLALKLPEDILESLPDETGYEIRFNCPLKVGPGEAQNPADRIPKHKLSELEKKARYLTVVTGQPYESILEQMLEKEFQNTTDEEDEIIPM